MLFCEVLVVVVAVESDSEEEATDDEEELLVLLVEVVARSNVVESTANSVGEPTRSKVIDEALDAGPDPFELAVEETEVAKIWFPPFVVCPVISFCCCWLLLLLLTTTIRWPFSS